MNSDLQTIANATDTKPESVQEAEAFATAAADLLATVSARTAPDLTTATPDTLARLHKAAVTYTATHAAELEHAQTLASIAASRIKDAWSVAVHALTEGFAADFDATAQALAAESARLGNPDPEAVADQHWNPDYAELRALSGHLDMLRQVRDAYANLSAQSASVVSHDYEQQSRLLDLPDNATVSHLISRLGRQRSGVRYWLTVTRLEGVTVKWQTRAQQEAQPAPARVSRQHAQLHAAQLVTR
jgi:hypothetical protein